MHLKEPYSIERSTMRAYLKGHRDSAMYGKIAHATHFGLNTYRFARPVSPETLKRTDRETV